MKGKRMEQAVYNADSLTESMHEFETAYGMASRDFYARHLDDSGLDHMPRFERHVWASFYEDVQRMRGEDAVMDRVSRTFAIAT